MKGKRRPHLVGSCRGRNRGGDNGQRHLFVCRPTVLRWSYLLGEVVQGLARVGQEGSPWLYYWWYQYCKDPSQGEDWFRAYNSWEWGSALEE